MRLTPDTLYIVNTPINVVHTDLVSIHYGPSALSYNKTWAAAYMYIIFDTLHEAISEFAFRGQLLLLRREDGGEEEDGEVEEEEKEEEEEVEAGVEAEAKEIKA
ncbi:hypothetical protein RF55_24395 [Lasius niger]|uniref:Uncharacterized protein n=1 Tax=Lasius niger TaxID=67767 RepID=A0A0J7JUW0_LASNI|nr:hypothetical protein RF55_24395 [Lasius niger]